MQFPVDDPADFDDSQMIRRGSVEEKEFYQDFVTNAQVLLNELDKPTNALKKMENDDGQTLSLESIPQSMNPQNVRLAFAYRHAFRRALRGALKAAYGRLKRAEISTTSKEQEL